MAGARFAPQIDNVFHALHVTRGSTPVRALAATLGDVLQAREALVEGAGTQEVTNLLDSAAAGLDYVSRSQLGAVPYGEWVAVPQGIFVTGIMTLHSDRSPARTARLFSSAAHFTSALERATQANDATDRLRSDRLLVHTIMTLSGAVDATAIDITDRSTLAAVLVRIGLVSAGLCWPAAGILMPNRFAALWDIYGNLPDADLDRLELPPPSAYISLAHVWRRQPLGDVEWLISVLMDHGPFCAAQAGTVASSRFPYDPIVWSIANDIDALAGGRSHLPAPRAAVELARRALTGIPHLDDREVSLPKFIATATSHVN